MHPSRGRSKVRPVQPKHALGGSCTLQVSKEEEGKLVDSKCHKLTASFVRRFHQRDKNVPVCLYYEVNVVVVNRADIS